MACLDAILRTNPDVAFISEAYAEGDEQFSTLQIVRERLQEAGYQVATSLYHDADDRADRHGMLAMSRLPGSMEPVRLGTRTGMLFRVEDPATGRTSTLLGMHADDRSSEARDVQFKAALELDPDALLGDLNETSGRGIRNRLLGKLMTRAVGILPYEEPRRGASLWNPKRLGNIATRLSGMLSGSNSTTLRNAGFIDSDQLQHPTWPSVAPRIGLQLDRILTQSGRLVSAWHKVLPSSGLDPAVEKKIDHLRVSCTVSLPGVINPDALTEYLADIHAQLAEHQNQATTRT